MVYSDLYLPKSPKIPTFVFLLVILAVFIFLSKLFGTNAPPSSASKSVLDQHQVVNLSYNQAAIFWQTHEKSRGWLIYSDNPNSLTSVVLDDRDIEEKKNEYINHLVTLKNLKEDKTYYYKLISNDKLIADSGNSAFSFKTAGSLSSSSNLKPAYGKIISKNGTPLENATVILQVPGTYSLVAFTKSGGDWLLPLNNLIDLKTGKGKSIELSERINVEINDEAGAKTSLAVIASLISPLPQTLIIGKDYNFLTSNNVLSVTTDVSQEKSVALDVIFPKEAAVIPGSKPLIKGSAKPGSEVIVTVNSQKTYTFRVKADGEGIWRVSLPEGLEPGSHKVGVTYSDQNQTNSSLVRSFTIAKSGEQVLGLATPEATPISSASPTLILFPTNVATYPATLAPSGSSPIVAAIISGSFIILGLGLLLAF